MSPAAVSATPPPATNGKLHPLQSSAPAIISPSSTASPPSSKIPAWVRPDLTRLLRVEHLPGSFTSRAISLISLPSGAIFARISNPTPATCAYTSVQTSRSLHIELNCDLVYINHSCAPSLIFDMERWEVRVNPDKEEGIKEGEELTFFYPSTEWNMTQPFDCLCGQKACLGRIAGAKDMSVDALDNYWLSEHVKELLNERDGPA